MYEYVLMKLIIMYNYYRLIKMFLKEIEPARWLKRYKSDELSLILKIHIMMEGKNQFHKTVL